VVAAKANLFSGFNLDPLSVADCAHGGDAHLKNSNSHKTVPFSAIRNSGPTKKTAALIRWRFSVSRGEICSVNPIHRTSNQKYSFLIQGTLPLHLVGCQTPFPKSFLMLSGEYQIQSRFAITIRASEQQSLRFAQSGVVDLGELPEFQIFLKETERKIASRRTALRGAQDHYFYPKNFFEQRDR
jgi:hypothetical protein